MGRLNYQEILAGVMFGRFVYCFLFQRLADCNFGGAPVRKRQIEGVCISVPTCTCQLCCGSQLPSGATPPPSRCAWFYMVRLA